MKDIIINNQSYYTKHATYEGTHTNIDVSSWDMSNIKDASNIFAECYSVDNIIGLEKWNTTNFKTIRQLFYGTDIKSLNIANWDVRNVMSMERTFAFCELLYDLNLSEWNLANGAVIDRAFFNCKSLIELDLSSLDTSHILSMFDIFTGCDNLKTVHCKSEKDVMQFKKSGSWYNSINFVVK